MWNIERAARRLSKSHSAEDRLRLQQVPVGLDKRIIVYGWSGRKLIRQVVNGSPVFSVDHGHGSIGCKSVHDLQNLVIRQHHSTLLIHHKKLNRDHAQFQEGRDLGHHVIVTHDDPVETEIYH